MSPKHLQREIPNGFEGAVAGLTLPDVIQMNALNHFSGCITVQYGQNSGAIFFRNGEIVHANQGENVGETAFYEILQWPGGKFNLQSNVGTATVTIHENWKFLLMESCRLFDENRNRARNLQPAPEMKTGATMEGRVMSSNITDALQQIPGISQSVLLGKDGVPVNDTSYAAELLAAQGVYLAMLGDQLGSIFGVGRVKFSSVQGKSQHLLLYEAKNHFLSIAVNGDHQLGAVDAEIRTVLSPKK